MGQDVGSLRKRIDEILVKTYAALLDHALLSFRVCDGPSYPLCAGLLLRSHTSARSTTPASADETPASRFSALTCAAPPLLSAAHRKMLTSERAAVESRGRACTPHSSLQIMLDEALTPWIIEVNVSPDLSSSSPLDRVLKVRPLK